MPSSSAKLRPASYYDTHDPLKFRGKTAWKREATDIGLECGCKAYQDVLTAGRWRALGYFIKPGETACHRAGLRANTPLFCRCQTAPSNGYTVDEAMVNVLDGDAVPF